MDVSWTTNEFYNSFLQNREITPDDYDLLLQLDSVQVSPPPIAVVSSSAPQTRQHHASNPGQHHNQQTQRRQPPQRRHSIAVDSTVAPPALDMIVTGFSHASAMQQATSSTLTRSPNMPPRPRNKPMVHSSSSTTPVLPDIFIGNRLVAANQLRGQAAQNNRRLPRVFSTPTLLPTSSQQSNQPDLEGFLSAQRIAFQ